MKDRIFNKIRENNEIGLSDPAKRTYFKNKIKVRSDGYLNPCDHEYLMNYAIEHLLELLDKEIPNHFPNLMNHGEEYEIKFGCRKYRELT